MDKSDPPESFGVFKPVGHTVMAFKNVADREAVVAALRGQGFSEAAMVRYSPQEMVQQSDAQERAAGALSGFGHEIELIRAHRTRAEQGCCFLVVHAPTDEQAQRVADTIQPMNVEAAQHYHRFLIEEVAGATVRY